MSGPGAIHRIIREHRVGSSAQVSILDGVYSADDGEPEMSGKGVRSDSPLGAIRDDVGMGHLHFLRVPAFAEPVKVTLAVAGGAQLARGRAETCAELNR